MRKRKQRRKKGEKKKRKNSPTKKKLKQALGRGSDRLLPHLRPRRHRRRPARRGGPRGALRRGDRLRRRGRLGEGGLLEAQGVAAGQGALEGVAPGVARRADGGGDRVRCFGLRSWGWGGGREDSGERGRSPPKKKRYKIRRPLDVGPYLRHLALKYGSLYGLPAGRAEELVAPGLKLAGEALERARKR